ncbi:type I restriction enzyme endonuclease domain-containing protein [Micrococcaceae bacterium Sec5.8]
MYRADSKEAPHPEWCKVIAELVELAREIALDGNCGAGFTPPLHADELAFDDAVASNASAVEVPGKGVLPDIARESVSVMRRSVRTDWTVRDDVRARLRTSIEQLLVRFGPGPLSPRIGKMVLF